MCTRIIQTAEVRLLGRIYCLDTDNAAQGPPTWNGPPGADYAVVRAAGERRSLARMRWGFVPARARDASFAPANARSETVAVKPLFRGAFAARRCILPVEGWYEWRRRPGARPEPYLVDTGDGAVLHLAAIWEPWRGPRGRIDGFAVLTTVPGPRLAAIHHRQPAVLGDDDVDHWLSPDTGPPELAALARLGGQRDYRIRAVGLAVNEASNDGPGLLAAARA